MDRYFTPFVCHQGLSRRELNDVLPENNQGMNVVPQIMANRASEFVSLAKKLADMGYREVNLNLGCPSGTVIKKKRGAGMLADPDFMEDFLTEIYEKTPIPVSIKTRLGMDSPEEWAIIQEIYNKFPISELIIHPRIQKDLYKRPVRPALFSRALMSAPDHMPVCYNGDIFTPQGFTRFRAAFPQVDTIMLGRGILMNPELTESIRSLFEKEQGGRDAKASAGHSPEISCEKACPEESIPSFLAVEDEYLPIKDTDRFRKFHVHLLDGYRQEISGEKNVLYKMKELWFYLGQSFPYAAKPLKLIKKAQSLQEYKTAVSLVLR